MKRILLIFLIIGSIVDVYGQKLRIISMDRSEFPIIKAKFYAYNSHFDKIGNFYDGDFHIRENGKNRTILSIECPKYNEVNLSSVLTIDVSSSMETFGNIGIAKSAAELWIKMLNLDRSECGITSFSAISYINCDLTTKIDTLKKALDELECISATNYNPAFLDTNSGAISIVKKGKNKKIIIFLTDGTPTDNPDVQKIITEAKKYKITIYCVALKIDITDDLRTIAVETGGQYYSVKNDIDAGYCYENILWQATGDQPCEITWESEYPCADENRLVEFSWDSLVEYKNYDLQLEDRSGLIFNPSEMQMFNKPLNKQFDTTITVTAFHTPINVQKIVSDNPIFDINPKKFFIEADDSITLHLLYTPVDSSLQKTIFRFITGNCEPTFNALGIYGIFDNEGKTLKLTKPNGGEVFVVGSDTTITWEGINKQDTVRLDLSIDSGKTWQNITQSVVGFKYNWHVPKTPGNECLVSIKQVPHFGWNDSVLSFPNPNVNKLDWCGFDDYLAAGNPGGISIYNAVSGKFRAHLDSSQWTGAKFQWRKNGADILGIKDRRACIWNGLSGKVVKTFYNDTILFAGWSDNAYRLATLNFQNKITIYENDGNDSLNRFPLFNPNITNFTWFSGDNKLCVEEPLSATFFNVPAGNIAGNINFLANMRKISWNSDKSLIAANIPSKVQVYKSQTGIIQNSLNYSTKSIDNFAWSPNNHDIAISSNDFDIVVMNVYTGKIVLDISTYPAKSSVCEFSPDGSKLALITGDTMVTIWYAAYGTKYKSLVGHHSRVNHVKWSPDGKYLASADDESLKIWDVAYTLSLQSDVSDSTFAIVIPKTASKDVDMGECVIGSNRDSIVQDFVMNTGTYKCKIHSIYFTGADSSAFAILSGLPPFILESGMGQSVEFLFRPGRPGLHTADIVIVTQTDTLVQHITGIGLNVAIQVENGIIDFGKVKLGDEKDTLRVVTIKNISTIPIKISKTVHAYPNKVDFTTISGGGPFTIQPGDTHLMDLRFKPSKTGRTNGVIEFHFNESGSPVFVQLYGEGINLRPQINYHLDSIPDLVCLNKSIFTLKLFNIGFDTLSIDSMNISGVDKNDFSINESTLPLKIAPDSAFILNGIFYPASSGSKTAQLTIKSNSEKDSILIINLIADKDSVHLSMDTGEIDLGLVCQGESVDSSITILNSGTIATGAHLENSAGINPEYKELLLAVGNSHTIPFTYLGSSQEGVINEFIDISDSICGATKRVNIVGRVGKPELEINKLNFSVDINEKVVDSLIIKNINKRAITIKDIINFSYPFTLLDSAFPITLKSGDSIKLGVEFLSGDTARHKLNLQISGDPCAFSQNFAIEGRANDGLAKGVITAGTVSAYPGDIFEIPVNLTDTSGISVSGIKRINFEMTYNSTILIPIDCDHVYINPDLSKIQVQNVLLKSPELIKLRFKAGLGDVADCPLSILNIESIGGLARFDTCSGKFNLLGICPEGGDRLVNPNSLVLLSVQPNPANGTIKINLNLTEKGHTSLLLTDVTGKTVKTLLDTENDDFNSQSFSMPINDLFSGEYFLVLKTPTLIRSEKISIIK